MTQENKIRIHRSRKPAMIQLAKEFAAELEQVCKKYNSQLKPNYTMIITSQDFKEGLMINSVYKVVLLDQFFPENDRSPIALIKQ